MTLKAPGHAVRLGMIHDRRLVNFAVTTETADAAINVCRVIVKNVIGRAMNLHPFDRLSCLPTRPNRLQFRIFFFPWLLKFMHVWVFGRFECAATSTKL